MSLDWSGCAPRGAWEVVVEIARGSLLLAYVSERGKYVRVEVEFWYDKDGTIHLVYDEGKGEGEFFHTTINDKNDSKRGHPNLYNHLKAVLNKHGKWPTESNE